MVCKLDLLTCSCSHFFLCCCMCGRKRGSKIHKENSKLYEGCFKTYTMWHTFTWCTKCIQCIYCVPKTNLGLQFCCLPVLTINGVYVAEFPRPYIFMHASGQANDKKCIQFIIYLLVLYYHTVADLHSGFFTRHPFEKFWPWWVLNVIYVFFIPTNKLKNQFSV